MSKGRIALALAALLWAGPALAQGNAEGQITTTRGKAPRGEPVGGILDTDSTYKVIRLLSDGSLPITEQAPIQDLDATFENIISNASVSAGAADSSGVLDTRALRHMKLLFKITPILNPDGADSLKVIRFAVQIRTHLNGLSDSSSVFAEYAYANIVSGATSATGTDTTNAGHLQYGTASVPWSGEFMVTAAASRVAHGSEADAIPDLFYYPNGIAISLDSMFGREFWSPYTSIRVRNLTAGVAGKIVVHLIGTPL